MPKLFVVSDIHSFYTPLKKALDAAGFDPNNKNHWLVSCGDAFDRGNESLEVLNFLIGLDRKILIKGNHEDLLEICCKRGFPQSHDKSNGTTRTIQDISHIGSAYDFHRACDTTYNKTSRYRELLVNYFETKNYIFVHGWVPCFPADELGRWPVKLKYEYNENWRKATEEDWAAARWLNGIDMHYMGIVEPEKTIVCGHWHCSYGHSLRRGCPEFEYGAIWEPYTASGIIALDRCTAYTGECNIVVLEDDFFDS